MFYSRFMLLPTFLGNNMLVGFCVMVNKAKYGYRDGRDS